MKVSVLFSVVRLAGFEPATFGSGDRRSNPTELQAHRVNATRSEPQFPTHKTVPMRRRAGESIYHPMKSAGKMLARKMASDKPGIPVEWVRESSVFLRS
jgi:hypothetical protein